MAEKFCILFAGAIGSSKTPIANYLSGSLNLPVFNNDSIRTEILEDLGKFNHEEYIKRRNKRFYDILNKGSSFILDASIDRSWERDDLKGMLKEFKYKYFIISLDLSKKFLKKVYEAKGYKDFGALDRTIKDHKAFLEKYRNIIGLHISDSNFKHRMNLGFEAIMNQKKMNHY